MKMEQNVIIHPPNTPPTGSAAALGLNARPTTNVSIMDVSRRLGVGSTGHVLETTAAIRRRRARVWKEDQRRQRQRQQQQQQELKVPQRAHFTETAAPSQQHHLRRCSPPPRLLKAWIHVPRTRVALSSTRLQARAWSRFPKSPSSRARRRTAVVGGAQVRLLLLQLLLGAEP